MANETILINDDLRTMQIPESIKLLGVESDDDVNKIPFQMPKEYCGFDLSTFEARINYMNANGKGDLYIVDDLTVDGDDPSKMNFTWLVGRNACAYKGDTRFIVCLKKFDDKQNVVQEFNTTVYSLPVLEGLETTEAVIQQNPDIIEHILKMIEDAGSIDMSNYYTKPEVNALKLANPHALIINGVSYDGSQPVEMTIEGGSSATETVSGTIIHVTDAVPNMAAKTLNAYNADDEQIQAVVCVANKNLFRLDQIASQTVSKGITFIKDSNGVIHATGTSTGTYASAQCQIDAHAFVVGKTYTISSGKSGGGVLYVQLIVNYADGSTDYLVANSTPYTFTVAKPIASVTGSVQITNSGVTVDEFIYPMVELSDSASAFTNNYYETVSLEEQNPSNVVLPDAVTNIWSNDNAVNNLVMEYWNNPVLAQMAELEAEMEEKITHPTGGTTGQVLAKTDDGVEWKDASNVSVDGETLVIE